MMFYTFASQNTDLTGQAGVPDGIIDMRDIGSVARYFRISYPCQCNGPCKATTFILEPRKRGDCAGEIGWSELMSSSFKFCVLTKLFMF